MTTSIRAVDKMSRRSRVLLCNMEYKPLTGMNADFSALLKKFVESGSVRYEQFAEIWREMEMMSIFYGRQNDGEVRELTERCFQLAKTFMLPPNEFQIQIGGLYLLYALYFKQLFEPKSKIRVTMEDWAHIQTLMTEVRTQNHYDIEYIFYKLRHHNAFHYCAYPAVETGIAFQSGSGMEGSDNRNQEGTSELDHLNQDHSSVAELMEGENIDQLSALHDQYHRVKCAMAGPTAKEPQVSLNMIDSNFVQYITKKITTFEFWKKNRAGKRPGRRRHDSGPTTSESEADSETEKSSWSPKRKGSTMGRRRAEIKARAMSVASKVPKSRRHRKIRSMTEIQEALGLSISGSQEEETSPSKSLSLDNSEVDTKTLSMPSLTHLVEEKRETDRSKRSKIIREKQTKSPKQKQQRKKTIKVESSIHESQVEITKDGAEEDVEDIIVKLPKKRGRKPKRKNRSDREVKMSPNKKVAKLVKSKVDLNVSTESEMNEHGDVSTEQLKLSDSEDKPVSLENDPTSSLDVSVSSIKSSSVGTSNKRRGRPKKSKKYAQPKKR